MSQKLWVCDDQGSTRFPVFTRGNVGEVFSEAVSPLTWSAYGPHAWDAGWRDAFCEIGAFTPDEFKEPGECEIIACFGAYIYINMSVTRVLAVRIPGMSIEAIDKALFGDCPDVPAHRPDPRDRDDTRSAKTAAWLASLTATDPRRATDELGARIEAVLARRPDPTTLSDSDLLAYFRSLRPDARFIFKRHVLNTYGGNVLAGMIAQMTQSVGSAHLASQVTAAVGDIDSARHSFELWDLSRAVRSSASLTAAFGNGVEGLLDSLRASQDSATRSWLVEWDRFIDRWGYMGPSIWEFRSPTYRSDPNIPLRMLERARRAPDELAPSTRAARLIAEREAAIADVGRRLAGDPALRSGFFEAARSIGQYMAARERSKGQCATVVDVARTAVRELGQRLVQRGLLSCWEHVLLVTDDEADAFVARPGAYRSLVDERAARLELLRRKVPPFVFEGEPPPLSAYKDSGQFEADVATAGTSLAGIGVSPGRYTGRARVVASLTDDCELEPGEVIVAVTTDASWGPLFLSAGAVVVETGAAISHAAIVSRELGIPAAVSVGAATRRIANGSVVTVDGNTGTVMVH